LRDTDILVLPYRSMAGTIDPPLLLLEAMAAGCACLTCPVGNVAEIYGESPFIIRGNFVPQTMDMVQAVLSDQTVLERERERVKRRILELNCATSTICATLVNQCIAAEENFLYV